MFLEYFVMTIHNVFLLFYLTLSFIAVHNVLLLAYNVSRVFSDDCS